MKTLDLLVGKPLATSDERAEQVGPARGIPIFGLDALSSAAYGPEAALSLLIPLGLLGLRYILPISTAIIILLVIVYFSYRQTIAAYPMGGGSYTVARFNLGPFPGLLAAAALLTDYILTAAVGISAGVGALVSAVPSLEPHTVSLCVGILVIITLMNLRGLREAGFAFMLPTYLFVGTLFITIGGCLLYTSIVAKIRLNGELFSIGPALAFPLRKQKRAGVKEIVANIAVLGRELQAPYVFVFDLIFPHQVNFVAFFCVVHQGPVEVGFLGNILQIFVGHGIRIYFSTERIVGPALRAVEDANHGLVLHLSLIHISRHILEDGQLGRRKGPLPNPGERSHAEYLPSHHQRHGSVGANSTPGQMNLVPVPAFLLQQVIARVRFAGAILFAVLRRVRNKRSNLVRRRWLGIACLLYTSRCV